MFDIKLRNAVANGLFGKLLNLASEEVILELSQLGPNVPNFVTRVRVFSVGQGRPAFLRLHL